MKPGESFDVDDVVIEENRDLFIKILCFFIMDYPSRYLFNNTYTTFYRLKPTEKFPAETLEQQLDRIVRKKY